MSPQKGIKDFISYLHHIRHITNKQIYGEVTVKGGGAFYVEGLSFQMI